MAYKGLIPGCFPAEEMKRSRVLEVSPDITMTEGCISDSFFFKPPSCKCFVSRDEGMVLLVDTGTYPFCLRTILDALEGYRRDGGRVSASSSQPDAHTGPAACLAADPWWTVRHGGWAGRQGR